MSAAAQRRTVAVVDPFSTGCCVALECVKRGCDVIAVWTSNATEELKSHRPDSCADLVYQAEVTEGATAADTLAALRTAAADSTIVAVMVGGDTGVGLADALSEGLGLRTNGTHIPARRDKKIQQELVKAAGLRSVRQAGGTKISDVEEFLKSEPMPVVVKPVESAGSDGVKLCHTKEEAVEHFNLLMTVQQRCGSQGAAVICQEFLKGKEYVVDHVSVDGVHKTVMIWVYDKRAANGSAFVYFGMLPVRSDSPEAKAIIPYVRGVLDALQIKNGPSHGEVMMTEDGPCLVEMNCRAHGGDGVWAPLSRALTGGYSQIDAGVDSFLNEEAFNALPDQPVAPFKAVGQIVDLVSFTQGKVTATPGYDKIKAMSSFVYLEEAIKPGSTIERTVDLFTNVGSAVLINSDAGGLKADLEEISRMQEDCTLFDLEDHGIFLKRPRAESHEVVVEPAGRTRAYSSDRPDLLASPGIPSSDGEFVVVVDPYSTGCCVAEEAWQRGNKVICLWSQECSDELKTHRPHSCHALQYHAEVSQRASLEETSAALKEASAGARIYAVICGGESGVPLADSLSEHMGVRSNGTQVPQRRDKKIQQELVKACGLRSVRQAGGTRLSDIEEFLRTEGMPVVVKPVESAGSDGVKLCHSVEEATEHFHVLMNSQQKVGSQGAAVLCQEFLKGKEYVIDQVSRDGEHKTVMIWCYDKRAVNGSAFVYFGMVPIRSDSPEAQVLIPYVRGVLDALQIRNGPTHGEVMMTADGPCLVEMNCRAHGGDGSWTPLSRALTGGYSQVDVTVDAFLDKQAFAQLPERPPAPFKAAGQEIMFVSFARGTVKATPGYEKIRGLASFVFLESSIGVGSEVDFTVDLFTNVGSAILMHADECQLEADIEIIRQMERDNALFEFEEHPVVLGRPRAASEERPNCEELLGDAGPAAAGNSWCSLM